jgi:hypothetical protein
MNIKAILGIVAFVVNLIGYVPYIRDVYVGKVKPHRVSWFIWMILTGIVAYNQVRNGGGWSSLFFISTTFLVTIVFILSLTRGITEISHIDKICLVSALVLLGYWVTLRDTNFSTYLAVIIDAIGLTPTIIKTLKNPETESYIQWVLAAVAGVFTVLSVAKMELVLIVYPIYIIIGNGCIVAAKYLSPNKTVDS